jgi:transketolase
MRTAFINTLRELAEKNKNIFLLNGDLGFSVLEEFTKAYPERSLNMGVAEANMIGVAAGLALSGKIVFVYSIIPFVTARVFEQVRNDVALQKTNVKIVGVGSGLTYGQLGPTHHSIEDIALMRALPNMTVVCPGDPFETIEATKALVALTGPAYLRIGKKGEPVVHKNTPVFKIGKGIVIQKGNDGTLIATGNMLPTANALAAELAGKGKEMRLISLHTVKPLDRRIIIKAAEETPAIFTLEEHNVIGGLGSAVAEALAEAPVNKKTKHFRRFGINDRFTLMAGSHDFLRNFHALSLRDMSTIIWNDLKKIK